MQPAFTKQIEYKYQKERDRYIGDRVAKLAPD
jgi:hypothetical protein